MKAFATASLLALGLIVNTGIARANVFEDLKLSAPRSVFEDLSATAPAVAFIELLEDSQTFEMADADGRTAARIGRDAIAYALPAALLFELSKQRP